MQTKQIIIILNEAFLPQNVQCDGAHCQGCWKDKIRQAIKILEENEKQNRQVNIDLSHSRNKCEQLKHDKDKFMSVAYDSSTKLDLLGEKYDKLKQVTDNLAEQLAFIRDRSGTNLKIEEALIEYNKLSK